MFLLQPKPSASTPVTHSKVSVHNAKASTECGTVFNLPLPASCVPLSPLPGRTVQEAKKTKMSSDQYSTAQIQLKHWSVFSVVFLLKLNHSIIPDTMKKINSVPSENRKRDCSQSVTLCHCSSFFPEIVICATEIATITIKNTTALAL